MAEEPLVLSTDNSSPGSAIAPAALAQRRGFPIGPLLWIVLTPILTIPITLIATGALLPSSGPYATYDDVLAAAAADHYCSVIIGGSNIFGGVSAQANCPDRLVVAALSPGLLNLLPFLWLLSRKPETQLSAVLASVLGTLRVAVPMVAVLTLAPTPGAGCLSADLCSLPPGFTVIQVMSPAYPNSWNAVGWISIALWVLTVVVYLVCRRRFARKSGV
jgi:hypothetical protein